jgi:outer membrane protein assembly factor BamB
MTNDIETPGTVQTSPASNATTKPPRIWLAVVLVACYWIVIGGAYLLDPLVISQLQHFLTIFYAPLVLAAGILVWGLFFSRLPWVERFVWLGLLAGVGIATTFLIHKSMAFAMLLDALPIAITVVVLTTAVTYSLPRQTRWLAIGLASVLAWGYFTLLRFDGVTGNLTAERSWRWSDSSEDTFLAELKAKSAAKPTEQPAESTSAVAGELVAGAGDWTAFRGPLRDGHVLGVSFATDWNANPPKRLWQRRVGPGWSSFAVVGNRAFTQEQRGKQEAVVALDINTGDEIWAHKSATRFEEAVSGAGPRATPTFEGGKIYALGGSGVLNCLDAATGKLIWSRDVTVDAKAKPADKNVPPPMWGHSSSPLVTNGLVVVFAGGGKDEKGVLAYDATSGEPRWSVGKGVHSYSSPQLGKFGGEEQVLVVSDFGLEAIEPVSGKIAWEHKWHMPDMFRVCQPHIAGDGLVLLSTPLNFGTRLLEVAKDGDDWKVNEKWTSKDLKPYFNDFVQHGDHLYGFDNDILVCVDLATGKKKWKKGRYGNGQLLLVGDQGLMLVISEEEGEAVLLEVSPKGSEERGKFKAVEGKTWNHPVIVGNKLLVRNSEQMACYELSPPTGLARN